MPQVFPALHGTLCGTKVRFVWLLVERCWASGHEQKCSGRAAQARGVNPSQHEKLRPQRESGEVA